MNMIFVKFSMFCNTSILWGDFVLIIQVGPLILFSIFTWPVMFPFHPYCRPIPKTILKIRGWFAFTKKLHIVLFQQFQRYVGNSDILKLLVCFLWSKVNFPHICREKTDVIGNKTFITLINHCYNFCFVSAVVLWFWRHPDLHCDTELLFWV